MEIKQMFKHDIDRPINGVIQVEQTKENVVKDEIAEYVITTELRKRFADFFNSYSDSLDNPTDNTGVWIQGFFGSGKSHFLKMLSYLLSNKEIDGEKTVEIFRKKFDDEGSFMAIQKAVSVPTETILFNIGVEAFATKDDTAILKVFTKTFFNHLGFYGSELKLARLEQSIAKQGKYEEFKQAFKDLNGEEWEVARPEYLFWEDDIVAVLGEVLGKSEESARHMLNEEVDTSIDRFVNEVKEYLKTKPKNFRLLFMIDEVGQYVGTNSSLLLELQSIVELLGSKCNGQVWVIATGQEALDEMIKLRMDEFSKILARFKIRLSLTSSSVGEVIEKRILDKKPEAEKRLADVYNNNSSVIKNLYTFDTNVQTIRGYKSEDEFVRQFPILPYQFVAMPKVLNEIRRHGHIALNTAKGERTMLEVCQDSTQRVEEKDEFSIVPFYLFYETLHKALRSSVSEVVEKAERIANDREGLYPVDVNVLKLLFLIRYVDDIPSNLENIAILMADNLLVDKAQLKTDIKESLNRLVSQNFASYNNEVYTFLTDEEQDVAREISATDVDSSSVINEISKMIFGDIYSSSKFRYNTKYDFEFDRQVDGFTYGVTKGGMKLRFITAASDPALKSELKLISDSKGSEAICVLSEDYPYYSNMEYAAKINKFVMTKNISALSDSLQKIITDKQSEAKRLLKQVKEDIEKSIIGGTYYIDGAKCSIPGTTAKAKIDGTLEQLVGSTYSKLTMITETLNDDTELMSILNGTKAPTIPGMEPNKDAREEVEKYLDLQNQLHRTTSMYDLQTRYQDIPYGWREIDVASVIAYLAVDQKVTIKRAGQMISLTDRNTPGYLRKRNEVGNTVIAKRENISSVKLGSVNRFLKDYFGVMDVPTDEDGIISYAFDKFDVLRRHYFSMQTVYNNQQNIQYPGKKKLDAALSILDGLSASKADNIAYVNKMLEVRDDLLDSRDDMQDIENFFDVEKSNQKVLFDTAAECHKRASNELVYFDDAEVTNVLNDIKDIIKPIDNYNFGRIKDLNSLISKVKDAEDKAVILLRTKVMNTIDQCFELVKTEANKDITKTQSVIDTVSRRFDELRTETDRINDLLILDRKVSQVTLYKDSCLQDIANKLAPKAANPNPEPTPAKKVRSYQRQVIFSRIKLKSKEDIEKYTDDLKKQLLSYLDGCDEIDIQ